MGPGPEEVLHPCSHVNCVYRVYRVYNVYRTHVYRTCVQDVCTLNKIFLSGHITSYRL